MNQNETHATGSAHEATVFFDLPLGALGASAPTLGILREQADAASVAALSALAATPKFHLSSYQETEVTRVFSEWWQDVEAVKSTADQISTEYREAAHEMALFGGDVSNSASDESFPELKRLSAAADALWLAVDRLHQAEVLELNTLAREAAEQRLNQPASKEGVRRGIKHRLEVYLGKIQRHCEVFETKPDVAIFRWSQLRTTIEKDAILSEDERVSLFAKGDHLIKAARGFERDLSISDDAPLPSPIPAASAKELRR